MINIRTSRQLNLAVTTICGLIIFFLATAIAAPAQTLKTLGEFDYTNGAYPLFYGSLVEGTNGNFYGVTLTGTFTQDCTGCGTVFEVTTGGALSTIYTFCSQSNCADGVEPYGGLVLGTNGNFYGTTSQGGVNFVGGTVYEITPTGTLTTLYSFCSQTNCADGSFPTTGLVEGKDGNFYGTTSNGGANGSGTIFKITPTGELTTLYSFCSKANCADGSLVYGALVQGSNGNFYGTTLNGGANGWGTVFEITATGELTTLHSFEFTDGATPYGGLAKAKDGNFYGTTAGGGKTNNGVVFKMTSKGKLSVIYNFCADTYCTDGGVPTASLIQGSDGDLYGTTDSGGTYYRGAIFEITTKGVLSTLHSFKGPDGEFPNGGLVQASNGELYGATAEGGELTQNNGNGWGTVYSLTLPTREGHSEDLR